MKKIILFLLLNVFLFSGFAQSLLLYHEGELLLEDETITLTAHADSGVIAFEGLEVMNSGNNPLNIKCAREVQNEVLSSHNSFCWGICYSPTTDTSTVSIKINPGEFSNEFIGDYFPEGNSGITTVRYIFYDVANPDDQVTFILNYKATAESGKNDIRDHGYFSPAYPNPANKEVSIDYNLVSQKHDMKLVIYNLLGEAVKQANLSEFTGTITLNTSTLTEGIYFYSFLINNEPTLTHKLIVKH